MWLLFLVGIIDAVNRLVLLVMLNNGPALIGWTGIDAAVGDAIAMRTPSMISWTTMVHVTAVEALLLVASAQQTGSEYKSTCGIQSFGNFFSLVL